MEESGAGSSSGNSTHRLEKERNYEQKLEETAQGNDKELKQLQAKVDELNRRLRKDNVHVQNLRNDIASSDQVREENQKLREENLELRERIGEKDERLKLVEEIAKFKHENTTLQIQNDALRGSRVSEDEEE